MTKVDRARKTEPFLIESSKSGSRHISDSGILAEIVYKMYFIAGKTQREVADVLGFKSTQPIRRIFREMGWNSRYTKRRVKKREEINDEEIKSLYFNERLSLREIAYKLTISLPMIRRIFYENSWQVRGLSFEKENKLNIDIHDVEKEVYRLYFEEGLSQARIALKIGHTSDSPIRRIFAKNGWVVKRSKGLGKKKRVFLSEDERQEAIRTHKKKTEEKITALRDQLFGTKCKICDCSKEKRTIAIHRKDVKEHDETQLWRISFLESLDPDEWAALCIACHRGVHWMMKTYRLTWNEIESISKNTMKSTKQKLTPLKLPDENTPSSEQYEQLKLIITNNPIELKRAIFGNDCHFCGSNFKERRLVLHRKDGRLHDSKLTEQEKYHRTINPEEWVSLCQKCHRYVHWAMDTLNMTWTDLKKDGASGEI